jgi:hypothetical protein
MTRPTEDLNDVAAWPFLQGAKSVRVNVSRYDEKSGEPACYQVWVMHEDPKFVPVMAARANPISALAAACDRFEVACGLKAQGLDPSKYSLDTGECLAPEDEDEDFLG